MACVGWTSIMTRVCPRLGRGVCVGEGARGMAQRAVENFWEGVVSLLSISVWGKEGGKGRAHLSIYFISPIDPSLRGSFFGSWFRSGFSVRFAVCAFVLLRRRGCG